MPVLVDSVVVKVVQVGDLDATLDDKEVVAHHDAANGGQEDRVRQEVLCPGEGRRLMSAVNMAVSETGKTHGGKVGGRLQEVPRADAESDESRNVAAASDVQVPRHDRRQVAAGAQTVRGNVGTNLGDDEPDRDERDASAHAVRVVSLEESLHHVERVPDEFAKDLFGRGTDQDAEERRDGKAYGQRDDLGEDDVGRFRGARRKVDRLRGRKMVSRELTVPPRRVHLRW